GNIVQIESTAVSTYQQFEVSLSHYSKHLFLYFSYDLSKELNEADDVLSLPSNNYDLRADLGPSLQDSRHRLFSILDLDLVKGLSLGAVFNFSSATPYNITTGQDNNGDTIINDRPPGIARNSARGSAHTDLSMRFGWTIGMGKETSTARRSVRNIQAGGPDAFGGLSSSSTDKRYNLQLYVQAYNIINRANLINFVGVQSSPFFGQATAALPGRRIETGLKFNF
ncbi:MAG: hypothetical protein ACREAC_31145, partial [Blastocatellia bacterium]